ncbi:MAG TPA: AraC family transcriptional regulator [Pseudomonadales bacterium]|jgi:AraC-like DNA-binding protein|nr:AraC family transcriptional regulator [Pseudomonadales bacterium]
MAQLYPLQQYTVFNTCDLDEARDEVAKIFRPHRLEMIGKGKMDARQHHVPLGDISLNYIQYGAKVGIHPGCLDSFYLITLPINGSASIRNGTFEYDLSPNRAAILNASTPLDMFWEENCRQLVVQIDRCALEREMEVRLERPPVKPIEFGEGFKLKSNNGKRLQALVNYMYFEAEQGRLSGKSDETILCGLKASLFDILLDGGHHNYSDILLKPKGTIAPKQVKLAEQYIHANAENPISINELSRICGTTPRSLQLSFKKFRDTTPMAYYWRVRMQRARLDLLAAENDLTIAKVATKWGFNHLGRFSVEYKNSFGESPKQTLHYSH